MKPIRIVLLLFAVGLLVTTVVYFQQGPAEATTASLYEEAPEEALRVLFVGNSHTYVNDVPAMVQRIAHFDESSPKLWVDLIAPPGESLFGHVEGGQVLRRIAEEPWDFVVFHGQSLEPIVDGERFVWAHTVLVDAIRKAGATPIHYQIWPRAKWDRFYEHPEIPSPARAMEVIHEVSEDALKARESRIARVGEAWVMALAENPDLELYARDGNHAALRGSQLTALVIYRAILDEKLSEEPLWYPEVIGPKDAAKLQGIANAVPR